MPTNKISFPLHICMLAILIASPLMQAHAEENLSDQLNARKTQFQKTAPQEKQQAYETGIKLVKESGVLERAKNVGDKAPNFTLPNATGKTVTLHEKLKHGPAVLIWYRGEWCPYCNIQLADIQKHMPAFEQAGAQVIAISPEAPDNALPLQDKLELAFEVLSDTGQKTARQYGIVYKLPEKILPYYKKFDLAKNNKDDGQHLPLSASYVIDTDGTITYAFLDADYRNRASTQRLIEEVKKITKK